jgi:cytochrome c biogenesis protein CcmG/thiol:disulfide interchange protein DsbE
MAESTSLESVLPNDQASPRSPKRPRTRVFASLGLALVIIVAAWYIAGQQGIGDLGKGGVNQKLLPRAGEQAPDFTVTDLLGNQVSLSSLRGKTVWLNFWGSWCPPCRAEMPEIQAAYQQLAPEDVVLLSISIGEDLGDASLYAARNHATFPVYGDQYQQATGEGYPIYNYPTHIFIDPDGIVRHVVLTGVTTEDAISYAHETANRS